MSAASAAVPANGTWELWKSQTLSIVWMELRKNFISKRGFWIYLLAAAPPAIVWLHTVVTIQRAGRVAHSLSQDVNVLAILFQVFFLRPALFFGCVGIFTYLFRGEFVERSLHYYFLAPVRREVLVAAKFIAGAITAICFFGLSITLTFAGMYGHFARFEVQQWMFDGPGLRHLGAYLGITVLACLGWGSILLWMGIRFRNPIVPAIVLVTWESFNVFLPAYLRRISVLHYLQSLNPVQVQEKGPGILFAATAEPENGVVAVICILIVTALMLWLSARQLKKQRSVTAPTELHHVMMRKMQTKERYFG